MQRFPSATLEVTLPESLDRIARVEDVCQGFCSYTRAVLTEIGLAQWLLLEM